MNRLNVFGYGFLPWRFCNLWHNFTQIGRNLKYACQRIVKGYCDYDLWDLDRFYSQLFVNTLTDFSKNLYGAPSRFYDKDNDSYQPWINYLNEMRDHFYNSIEENEVKKNEYDDKYMPISLDILYNKGRQERVGKYWHLWLERYKEIDKWRATELNIGLDMLKEVYQDLWY